MNLIASHTHTLLGLLIQYPVVTVCTNDCNNVIIRIAFLPAADGDIDRRLGRLAAALTREAQKLEPQNAESPSIVLETATSSGERGQIIVRRENDLNVAIEKKQGSVFNCLLSFPFGINCNKLLHITYLKMYLFMSISGGVGYTSSV